MKFLQTYIKYISSGVLGMLGLSCYILADTYFISAGVGNLGLTALNIAIPVFSMISGVGLMIGVGASARFSSMRARADQRANNLFANACCFGLAAGLLITFIGIAFSQELCQILGADKETLAYTNEYLKTLMCTSLLFIMNNILTAFVRNDGNPRLSMTAMLVGSFSNIILDYVFIFPMKLGMFGAAAATAVAPTVSMMILSLHFITKANTFSLRRCRISLRLIGLCLYTGVFSFITELSSGLVTLAFNRVILDKAGNIGVAAYGIIANVALVAISVFTGISQGLQPIASVACARGNRRELHRAFRYSCILSLAFSVILMLCAIFFHREIVAIFNSEKSTEMAALAEHGLPLYFIGFFPAGLNIITASFLSACEKPKESTVLSFLRGIIFILPSVFLLSSIAGINGVWLSFGTAESLTFFFSVGFTVLFLRKFEKINKQTT